MKRKSRIVITALFSLILLGAGVSETIAQPRTQSYARQDVDRSMAYLTNELDLTSEQQDQIRPIMQAHRARQQELADQFGRGTGTPLAMRPEMKELRDRTHDQIIPYLNEVQRERYEELRQSPGFIRDATPVLRGRRDAWRGPRSRGYRSDRPMRRQSAARAMVYLTDELDLTADQQSQIKPIMEEHVARQAELFQQFGRGTGTPLAMRPEMQQLRQETHARIEPILNEGQLERYRELQETPGFRRGFDRPLRDMRGYRWRR